ncbi:MAG: hypothetical protein NC311_14275 [Muribaculaceae bacterium]|nr:hypothetical protein [Muribaculaceae bacterium]
MTLAIPEAPVLEREYGGYRAKICFASEDVPDVEKNLLGLIMQAYRQRVEQDLC